MRTEDVEEGFFWQEVKQDGAHSGLDGPNLHKVTSMWAKTTQQLSCSAQVYMFAAVFFKLDAGYFKAKILHARKNHSGQTAHRNANVSGHQQMNFAKTKKSCHKLFYVAYS